MVAVRDSLPAGLPDEQMHCLASAAIAQRCSVVEARLAGLGKELRDVFAHGDAAWEDWQADRRGVQCAARARGVQALTACCAAAQ
jgi:hypothetical protein